MENGKSGYISTVGSKLKKVIDLIFLLHRLFKMHVFGIAEKNSITTFLSLSTINN